MTNVEHRARAKLRQWVAVFPGARDSYQAVLALEEAALLHRFVTDIYAPLDMIPPAILARIPRGFVSHFARRFRTGLPSRKVSTQWRYAALTRASPAAWPVVSDGLGLKAATMAKRVGAGVLAYNHVATGAFEALPSGLPKALYQVQGHPASVRRILERGIAGARELGLEAHEMELAMPEPRFEKYAREPLLADLCIAPSRFVQRTLVEHGVPESRIRVIPYGVDLERFTPRLERERSKEFTVLWVGQVVYRKGIANLLEAWKQLALPAARLILVARGTISKKLLARYEGIFEFLGPKSGTELASLYREADLLCSPSLFEGFGLTYLEALASGTPIIGTANTGAADLVEEGRHGFIVPIHDVESLKDRLAWCHGHREQLSAMRPEARALAEQYSWNAYRRTLVAALAGMD